MLQAKQGPGGLLDCARQLRLVQTVWTVEFSFLNCLVIGAEYDPVFHEVRPSSELNVPDALDRLVYLVMASRSVETPTVTAMQQDRKQASRESRFVASAVLLRWFP